MIYYLLSSSPPISLTHPLTHPHLPTPPYSPPSLSSLCPPFLLPPPLQVIDMPDAPESEVQKVVEVQQEIAGVTEEEANTDEFQDAVGTYMKSHDITYTYKHHIHAHIHARIAHNRTTHALCTSYRATLLPFPFYPF